MSGMSSRTLLISESAKSAGKMTTVAGTVDFVGIGASVVVVATVVVVCLVVDVVRGIGVDAGVGTGVV